MRTLFVSDLDGTLMQPDARISEESAALINGAIAGGKLFSVATARTPATVAPILSGIDMRLPAIVITGAAMFDTRTHSYSHVRRFAPEVAESLLDIYRKTRTSTFMFTLESDVIDIYHLNGQLTDLQRRFYEERELSPYKRFHLRDDGGDTLPDSLRDAILFYTMLPDAEARAAYELVKGVEGVKAQYYHDIYGEEIGILEAFDSRATKATAVRTLAESAGAERVVCFGDNINDLPMMAVADVAVAVANARPEVKAAADIVIGPNTDDSVAKFIAGCEL